MKCTICDGNLVDLPINDEYYVCESCKTQIKKNTKPFELDYYDSAYLQNDNELKTVMSKNIRHYDLLFKTLANNQNFREISNSILSTTVCYGGGWPQIESLLPPSEIIVCDLIANKYKDKEYIFSNVFDITKKNIIYNNYNLANGVIKYFQPHILTFVHILEHLDGKHIESLFYDINKSVPSGSFGFIYQPNPATAFNKDWWHYAEEHITLMPQEAMCNLINKFDKLETTVSVSFSEDMLIIFRKN